MPRDNDKNNNSRGRRDRPSGGKGRSGAARGPEKKFAKRGFAGKAEGERRPYAGKPDGARSYAKKPYSGTGKPYGNRENRPPRRDDGDAPRPRGDRPFAASKRPSPRRSRRNAFNQAARAAAMRARPHASRTGNSATSGLTRRARVARSDPTPRAARVRKDGDRPRASGSSKDRPRGDRPYSARPPAMATALRENSAATRNFREGGDRARARISAIAPIAAIVAIQSPGRSESVVAAIHVGRNSRPRPGGEGRARNSTSLVSTSRVSTSRARTAAAMIVRAFPAPRRPSRRRPSVSRAAEIRPSPLMIARSSTVRVSVRGPHRLAGASAQ